MTAPPRGNLARTAYVAGVAGSGVLLLVEVLRATPSWHLGPHPLVVACLVVILVVGELRPIPVPRGDDAGDEISISSTIALALLMLAPVWVALAAQAFALALDELWRRRNLFVLLFNVGQYTIALVGARTVYALVVGESLLVPLDDLGPISLAGGVLAAATFPLLNHVATSTGVALTLRQPIVRSVLEDLRCELPTSGVLLPMAPVIALAATWSVWALPVLLLPITAVHRSARLAYEREREALHDTLTGLPNRALFNTRLERACRELPRHPFTVLLLDLDHFKEINDTLGHHAGDLLLQEVARRLTSVAREGDLVARLGGDEFAILLPGLCSRERITPITARFWEVVNEPVTLEGVRTNTAASIGVAVAPVDGSRAELLLQRADIAMYGAKRNRGCAVFYDAADDDHSVAKLALLDDLHRGISRGEVFLSYQPKCRLSDGAMIGFEGLVRWRHPTLGLLRPDRFLPLAEHTGLIEPMTLLLMREGLAQLRAWRVQGVRTSLAINLSPRLLADDQLPEVVAELLREHMIPAECLTLEVTEGTILADTSRTLLSLRLLRDLGVRISIDDFGTGYSSLAYLKRLEVDEIKIDKSFVRGVSHDADDALITRTIIELGHHFGLHVVAEGVEDATTLDRLRRLGCDGAQGYLLGAPMDAAAAGRWLSNRALARPSDPSEAVPAC